RKDAEFAKRLQEEWNGNGIQEQNVSSSSNSNTQAYASPPPPKQEFPKPPKTTLGSTATSFNLPALDRAIEDIELQQDIFTFDPAKVDVSCWPTRSGNVPSAPYALLSHACILLSTTKSRLIIVTVLTNLLRVLMYHDEEALLPCIYLVSNHIAPPYDGVELGLGGAIVNQAIRNVTGKSASHLRTLWNKTGDPGDVAFEAKKDVKTLIGHSTKPIEITKLFQTLHAIAAISGTGSSSAKMAHVTKLLVASRGEEARFLVRTLHSHLRINAVRTTITSAIARAFVLNDRNVALKDEGDSWCLSVEERQGILANPPNTKQRADPKRLAAMDKIVRAETLLREIRARHPNFGTIVPALLEGGLQNLAERVPLRVGTPISPMLGSITRSLPAMFDKLGDRAYVCEFKYDGQRVQIHAEHVQEEGNEKRKMLSSSGKGKWTGPNKDIYVRLFSRHLEDMTDKYPDIVNLVPMMMGLSGEQLDSKGKMREDDIPPVKSFIMDAEIVAMGLDGTLLPFQTLANRSRKDVELHNIKVAVGVFAFDLMQLNGRSLLKSSLRKRRNLLFQNIKPCKPEDVRIARFDYVKHTESRNQEDVTSFFELAQNNKCEGIMVKSLDHHWEDNQSGESEAKIQLLEDEVDNDLSQPNLDAADPKPLPGKGVNGRGKALLSTYEPDKRCESWLKVKKDYVDGIGDSLDLVPIAGWHGMGRKAAWWSPVLLAVYDAENDEYQAVCKCISGFTDAEYKDIKFNRFVEGTETCYNAYQNECKDSFETGGLVPDVWFTPNEVWEIRGADITLSPVYTAAKGLVSDERGLSLRFPRFMKRRTDKSPQQASTPRQLANMYFDQNNTTTA
ncbi:ATP-dependent DNA ligase, partial [Meira miltonrushii]